METKQTNCFAKGGLLRSNTWPFGVRLTAFYSVKGGVLQAG